VHTYVDTNNVTIHANVAKEILEKNPNKRFKRWTTFPQAKRLRLSFCEASAIFHC